MGRELLDYQCWGGEQREKGAVKEVKEPIGKSSMLQWALDPQEEDLGWRIKESLE